LKAGIPPRELTAAEIAQLSLTDYQPPPASGVPPVAFTKEPVLTGLVQDWQTTPGVGQPTTGTMMSATGLYPSIGEQPLPPPLGIPGMNQFVGPVLPKTKAGPGPRIPTMAEANQLAGPPYAGRPQMPVQPGIPGVADTAIAGSTWVDAAEGVKSRGTTPEAPVITKQLPNPLETPADRLGMSPVMPAVIEFQRLAAMPDSVNKILLMADFAKRHPELMTLFHPDPSVMKWPRN
jgi:hypothetical protein